MLVLLCLSCGANRNFAMVSVFEETAILAMSGGLKIRNTSENSALLSETIKVVDVLR
jgi:hypothetical protein